MDSVHSVPPYLASGFPALCSDPAGRTPTPQSGTTTAKAAESISTIGNLPWGIRTSFPIPSLDLVWRFGYHLGVIKLNMV